MEATEIRLPNSHPFCDNVSKCGSKFYKVYSTYTIQLQKNVVFAVNLNWVTNKCTFRKQ